MTKRFRNFAFALTLGGALLAPGLSTLSTVQAQDSRYERQQRRIELQRQQEELRRQRQIERQRRQNQRGDYGRNDPYYGGVDRNGNIDRNRNGVNDRYENG